MEYWVKEGISEEYRGRDVRELASDRRPGSAHWT